MYGGPQAGLHRALPSRSSSPEACLRVVPRPLLVEQAALVTTSELMAWTPSRGYPLPPGVLHATSSPLSSPMRHSRQFPAGSTPMGLLGAPTPMGGGTCRKTFGVSVTMPSSGGGTNATGSCQVQPGKAQATYVRTREASPPAVGSPEALARQLSPSPLRSPESWHRSSPEATPAPAARAGERHQHVTQRLQHASLLMPSSLQPRPYVAHPMQQQLAPAAIAVAVRSESPLFAKGACSCCGLDLHPDSKLCSGCGASTRAPSLCISLDGFNRRQNMASCKRHIN